MFSRSLNVCVFWFGATCDGNKVNLRAIIAPTVEHLLVEQRAGFGAHAVFECAQPTLGNGGRTASGTEFTGGRLGVIVAIGFAPDRLGQDGLGKCRVDLAHRSRKDLLPQLG